MLSAQFHQCQNKAKLSFGLCVSCLLFTQLTFIIKDWNQFGIYVWCMIDVTIFHLILVYLNHWITRQMIPWPLTHFMFHFIGYLNEFMQMIYYLLSKIGSFPNPKKKKIEVFLIDYLLIYNFRFLNCYDYVIDYKIWYFDS